MSMYQDWYRNKKARQTGGYGSSPGVSNPNVYQNYPLQQNVRPQSPNAPQKPVNWQKPRQYQPQPRDQGRINRGLDEWRRRTQGMDYGQRQQLAAQIRQQRMADQMQTNQYPNQYGGQQNVPQYVNSIYTRRG